MCWMEHRENGQSLRPPVIIAASTDLAAVLRGDREALALSGEDLDGRIGWCDRYTAKLESGHKKWGRRVFFMEPTADEWLLGLNRALVLMDRDEADRLIREHVSSLPNGRGLQRVRVQRLAFV